MKFMMLLTYFILLSNLQTGITALSQVLKSEIKSQIYCLAIKMRNLLPNIMRRKRAAGKSIFKMSSYKLL